MGKHAQTQVLCGVSLPLNHPQGALDNLSKFKLLQGLVLAQPDHGGSTEAVYLLTVHFGLVHSEEYGGLIITISTSHSPRC